MLETTLEAPVQTEQKTTEVTPPAFSPFKDNSWVETIPTQEAVVTPAATTTSVAETITPAANEEVFDENVYVKTKYGWETPADGLKELEELRSFKAKPFDFTNDDSRKAFEYLKEGKEDDLYKILDQKRKVNKLLSAETIDENIADQIIKMGMQTRYKDLTTEEIEYKFKKQFSVPPKPVYDSVNESEDEYAQKVSNWESAVSDVKMEKIIEAKVAKPELEKLKMELVLPDIPRVSPESAAPSQESLAEMQKIRDNFLAKLNSGYTSFKGYETKVKDESGEIPVAFVVPDEDKVAQRLKVENFEMDVYFNKRWFDENNVPNVEKIMADLYLLENSEKVFQGVANNAANQKLVQYIKQTSNINVAGTPPGTMQANTTQDDINKQIEYIWKQK